MKNILITGTILFILLHCFSQTRTDSVASVENSSSKLKISGTLFYTSISRGGIQRDETNLALMPLQKFTMCIISYTSADSIPKVMKSFTTNKNGEFSVTLPPGRYGFATPDEVKAGLSKGQCLPRKTQTTVDHTINTSEWECKMDCPLKLDTVSIKNLVIIEHLISFCVNCQ